MAFKNQNKCHFGIFKKSLPGCSTALLCLVSCSENSLIYLLQNCERMSIEAFLEKFKAQAAAMPSIGKTLKMVVDDQVVFIDLTGDTPQVSTEDREADCTISASMETLEKLRNGELNPMMAVMGGKVKIKGDMSVAMKLQSLLS
jgi:putative sterol carrier protein